MRKRAVVAIVGRPNVGKSTFFNRILRRREAVVHDLPGVTRDRHSGRATWGGRSFEIVDTGGLMLQTTTEIEALVRTAALRAIEEADLLLVVVDVNAGITDLDTNLADIVRRSGKPALVVGNKADDGVREAQVHEFHRLGLGEPLPVSAVHGTGTAAVLDRVLDMLPPEASHAETSNAELRLAIIGKPNVGKSSLVNAILGEERVLVSEQPGTTRDPIDSRLRWHGHEIDLIDTAGLRKRSRLEDAVDVFASIRALHSIERADVCVLVLDATEDISVQDTRIAGYAHKAGAGIVACFNKWDTVAKDDETIGRFVKDFKREFAFIRYAPIVFISALTHQRVHRVLEEAWNVGQARSRSVPTAEINRVLAKATAERAPHFHGGGNGNVKYGVQIGTRPPRFAIFVNNPDFFDRNYIRYLNNSLRAAFAFPGTALRLELRSSSESAGVGTS